MSLIKKNFKLLISYVSIICLINSCDFCRKKMEDENLKKNIPLRIKKNSEAIENRNDSLKWDYKMFKEDIKYMDEESNYPFEFGVFPTPKYNLLGKDSFKGLGYYRNKIEWNGKRFLTVGFYFNNNTIYKDKLNGLDNQVFFGMIIFLGNANTNNEEVVNHTMISSRNHPSYMGQGSYITSSFKIDYLAFITPVVDSYAIVNMRLFDLSKGSTVIIVPQKDRTLRSLQLKSEEIITNNSLERYFHNLIKKTEVEDFLNKPGSIE